MRIEDGVPIPVTIKSTGLGALMRAMEPGQSLALDEEYSDTYRRNAKMLFYQHALRTGKKFTWRKKRVWRLS